jgi:alpha-galactosidase
MMTPEVASILMNKQVIAIDQDPLGKEAERIFQEGPVQIWSRPLADGSTALALFNSGEDIASLNAAFLPGVLKQLGLTRAKAMDIWQNQPVKLDGYRPAMPRDSAILLKLSR